MRNGRWDQSHCWWDTMSQSGGKVSGHTLDLPPSQGQVSENACFGGSVDKPQSYKAVWSWSYNGMQRKECKSVELGKGELRWRKINGTSGAEVSELEQFFPRTQKAPNATTGGSVWRRASRQGWRERLTLWYIEALPDWPDYPGYEFWPLLLPCSLTWGKARFHHF